MTNKVKKLKKTVEEIKINKTKILGKLDGFKFDNKFSFEVNESYKETSRDIVNNLAPRFIQATVEMTGKNNDKIYSLAYDCFGYAKKFAKASKINHPDQIKEFISKELKKANRFDKDVNGKDFYPKAAFDNLVSKATRYAVLVFSNENDFNFVKVNNRWTLQGKSNILQTHRNEHVETKSGSLKAIKVPNENTDFIENKRVDEITKLYKKYVLGENIDLGNGSGTPNKDSLKSNTAKFNMLVKILNDFKKQGGDKVVRDILEGRSGDNVLKKLASTDWLSTLTNVADTINTESQYGETEASIDFGNPKATQSEALA